jgi:Fe-S oxidoreductase
MDQSITRPILWNVPVLFQVFMYGMLVPLGAVFVWAGLRWYRIVSLGKAEDRFDRPLIRLWIALRDAVGQGRVVRESWGWMHYLLYVAFVGLFIGTTIVFINSDIAWLFARLGHPFYFYDGFFYLVFKAAMDTFFLLIIVGAGATALRRAVARPSVLAQPPAEKIASNLENRLGYWAALILLLLVPLTGLMLEAARINAHPPGFVEWAYIARPLARLEALLGAGAGFHRWLWLFHVVLVYGLLFGFPLTKLRHFIFAPLNLFFRNLKPRGRLAPIADLENAEEFGVARVQDYTWKQLLDMASCLECGRCTINCPTVNTGKTLNPKFVVIEQRELLLKQAPALVAARQNASSNGEAKTEPAASGPDMITEVVTEAAIWGCTTCGWCEEGCPVGIEHIQRFVDMRRHQVLMEGSFPQEAANAFRGIENQGNPWGLEHARRADWAKGLDIPVLAGMERPQDLEVLYWVGCAGSYDERSQRVSRALVRVMQEAGVRFAILGTEERCTGDPARRLGNEYLYAMVAAQNVETLERYRPPRIVTQCPHCFHNLKNEYPDFGGKFEVVHEAEFIEELIRAGRLKPNSAAAARRVTYHDPCYMARHNGRFSAARSVLRALPGSVVGEVACSRERTFCCGAGGGCFWKEEREGTRINQHRFAQLCEADPETVAVGCPFCLTQMEDALKARSLEERMNVKDLAELVADALAPAKPSGNPA